MAKAIAGSRQNLGLYGSHPSATLRVVPLATGCAESGPEHVEGRWRYRSRSGGLDGQGLSTPADDSVIRGDQLITLGAAGEVAWRFAWKKGKTIFAAEPRWMMDFAGRRPAYVVTLEGDSRCLSPNVYDGIGVRYERVP
jgi:hypothetical protein